MEEKKEGTSYSFIVCRLVRTLSKIKNYFQKTKHELIGSNMLSDDNFYEIESALMDEELPKLNEYMEIETCNGARISYH